MITRTDLNWWLDLEPEIDWQFATTYADGAPHEYVTADRTAGLDAADCVRAAHVIQTFGEPMKFYKWTRIYLRTPMGWKHWTMDADLNDTNLVNRGRVEHVYGIQNMPMTRSENETPYDAIASTWDRQFGPTPAEEAETAALIREVFGEKLWRTLDVGCGTGWPLTHGLVEPTRYVGVDPSTGMLNALVAKHPVVAGLHPMRWVDAVQRRVLCGSRFDTVLALGGAASYLSPDELLELVTRSKRGAVVVHYGDGATPAVNDLDHSIAAQSLAAANNLATMQRAIGRFVLSFLPAEARAA